MKRLSVYHVWPTYHSKYQAREVLAYSVEEARARCTSVWSYGPPDVEFVVERWGFATKEEITKHCLRRLTK